MDRALLDGFQTISLPQFEATPIARRKETKFLLRAEALNALLNGLQNRFRILKDFGTAQFSYATTYFDTNGFDCYLAHLADVPGRIKLRLRHYEDSDIHMLELKQKGGDGRIHKQRLRFEGDACEVLSVARTAFLHPLLHEPSGFEAALTTRYARMSFLAADHPIRLSIDSGISMTAADGRNVALPGLAVVELKAGEDAFWASALRRLIRSAGGLQTPYSKYMHGMSLLHPGLERGILKPRQLLLQKLDILPCFS